MAIQIKGIDEITTLFPGTDIEVIRLRYQAYKWFNVRKYLQQLTYLITGVFAGLELVAKFFIV